MLHYTVFNYFFSDSKWVKIWILFLISSLGIKRLICSSGSDGLDCLCGQKSAFVLF